MKAPSNETIYSKILTNYYTLYTDEIFGASASSFFLSRLHYEYSFGFEDPCFKSFPWHIEDEKYGMVKRLSTFRLEADPIIELEITEPDNIFYKINVLLFLGADEHSIISQWNQDNIRLNEMQYNQYLQTDHWEFMRQLALHAAKHKCQLCYKNNDLFHVHHRTYIRHGNEDISDLIVLCPECHAKFHDKPSKEGGE